MSRITKRNDKYEVCYGLDHAVGDFLQVFELGKEEPMVDIDQQSVAGVERTAFDWGFNIKINDRKNSKT